MSEHRQIELLAEMPDGNFVRMKILRAFVTDEIVQVVVAYEKMADVARQRIVAQIAGKSHTTNEGRGE